MASEELGSAALSYHEATKHSEFSVRNSPHYLDWENKPSPFKTYRKMSVVALPRDFPHPKEMALRAIKGVITNNSMVKEVDIAILAEILFFSAGLTRKMRIGDRPYYMRAAPATGALYPIELYVICQDILGLKAGVYHFDPLNFALVELREGDYRAHIAAASDEGSLTSPVTIVLTSLAWRNAWKYEARSYRHWFWDSGVIAANLLATASSVGLDTKLVMGFVDPEVDWLLGIPAGREATVALAQIGVGLSHRVEGSTSETPSPLNPEVGALSEEEVSYPIIWTTNRESTLYTQAEVSEWKLGLKSHTETVGPEESEFQLPLVKDEEHQVPLGEVILRRGSTRRFARQAISFEQLSAIIRASTTEIPLDFLPGNQTMVDFYFIANSIDGLPSGSYYFHHETDSLKRLKAGSLRRLSGYLCLEQPLFSDASAVFYLMSDLRRVIDCFGNRGYRAAQFEAGIRAGKIYLSSYSVGIGASGSTFYDDAVTEFFSPHAERKSAMIAVGIGVPAYVARSGSVLPQMSAAPAESQQPR